MRGYLDAVSSVRAARRSAKSPEGELLVRRLDALHDPERAFVALYGRSPSAFWLDSSARGERGRFSFMGDGEGPLGAVVTYDVEARRVRVERRGTVETFEESIFEYLARALARLRSPVSGLPFGLDCGFAGYLGYELKADCDGVAAHRATTPDAAFVFADRMIAFDHERRHTYLLALPDRVAGEAERWIEEVAERLACLPPLREPETPEPAPMQLRRSRDRYLQDIAACKRYLRAGRSYEICLTNQVVTEPAADPLSLYRRLRRANPAPFAAYLRFGDVAVLSSSPERFLRIGRDGWVEARPIKGTVARGATPAEDARLAERLRGDAKSRSENVTIVDLLRNDLGRVCEFGTVEVPELMRVESYETLHQLVSSVRGRLRGDAGALECVRACFPPGSMTGAPKLSTVEILDELEGEARGVYSGAVGYLGLGGECDLSVAIRTIVTDGKTATIGAGGAIVAESDPRQELEEMLLKIAAPVAAMQPPVQPRGPTGHAEAPLLGVNL
jgi:para-aminobenzoate synthetase